MAEEHKETLLEKSYFYENCPGCKVDQHKQMQRGLPIKELVSVWMVVLCSSLPISSLFPFVYFMIRDFHIAKTEEDIGYYAGYVGSAFMFGRGLTSVLWGMISDRFGRKPVFIFGTISVVIFNTMFGLSVNFWMAISTRFLLGSLNGLLGPIKAYASEVFREEHQALGLSAISSAWGIGLIIGPALGGFLSQPTEKYPSIFRETSLFGRFPYLLPCLVISVFAVGVTLATFWLPETLHMHHDKDAFEAFPCDSLEAPPCRASANKEARECERKQTVSSGSLIRNWPLMSSIIVYCIFSLSDMAYSEIFSLWAVSPRRLGGLSFSTKNVGEVLSVTGLGLLLFQLFLFPFADKLLGPVALSRVAGALTIPLLSSYPFIAMLSGFSLALSINCASIMKNILSVSILTCLSLLQNKAVDQHQRGAAQGIAMSAMSLFKAAGPAGGGTIFSWAQKRQHAAFLPGNQMVFFILNVVQLIGILTTFKPFLLQHPK